MKKLTAFLLTLCMILSLFPAAAFADDGLDADTEAVTEYLLWVGNTQVTSENQDDIFGDGSAVYSGGEHAGILTLNDANISGHADQDATIFANQIQLTVEGSATLSGAKSSIALYHGGGYTLSLNGDFTCYGGISGAYIDIYDSNISARGDASNGYAVYANYNIYIEDSTLTVNKDVTLDYLKTLTNGGPCGIRCSGSLYIYNSVVESYGSSLGMNAVDSIYIEGAKTKVTAGALDTASSYSCAMRTINGELYIDEDDLIIASPEGASVSEDETFICEADGSTPVKTAVIKLAPLPFIDVPEGSFYYDAVRWAIKKEPPITTGTSDYTFSPDFACLRGQAVTFIWRAFSCPEPETTECPFTDVHDTDFFYEPVLWAYENGITTGTTDTTFSPNTPCLRGQVVTFLYRALSLYFPPVTLENRFQDVTENDFYFEPVLWASAYGITTGVSEYLFAPNALCLRSHVVTFLYRTFNTSIK